MKSISYSIFFFLLLIISGSSFMNDEDWGFFAHRKINRMAVFTCPPELIGFYKQHIDYLSDHAIDPDMRRHASKFEAIRHYIDIDHWGEFPFENVPRSYPEAIIKFGSFDVEINGAKYSVKPIEEGDDYVFQLGNTTSSINKDTFMTFFRDSIYPLRYSDSFGRKFNGSANIPLGMESLMVRDSFSDYGILPFSLLESHYRLVRAFETEDIPLILRLSADYGHYISDAHVPLHTTENYNGQLSGQDGIHAFWESRIPELYAEDEFDLFVGKAEYIPDLSSYFWDIVLDSHVEVDQVLGEELGLRKSFPEDRQFCYDERNGRTVRIQCPEFARAYQRAMGDMVEQRFRASIKSVGDLWYTAWVQAGRPKLSPTSTSYITEKYDTLKVDGKPVGREH